MPTTPSLPSSATTLPNSNTKADKTCSRSVTVWELENIKMYGDSHTGGTDLIDTFVDYALNVNLERTPGTRGFRFFSRNGGRKTIPYLRTSVRNSENSPEYGTIPSTRIPGESCVKMGDRKNIQITDDVHRRLRARGSMSETFTEVIERLLDQTETVKKA